MIDCAQVLWYTGITTRAEYQGAFRSCAAFTNLFCGQSAPFYRTCVLAARVVTAASRKGRFAIMSTMICQHCGNSFSGKDTRFSCCSWECFDAHFMKIPYSKKIKCAVCGKQIVKCGTRKYCSDACRQSLSRRCGIPYSTKDRIYRRDNWKCVYCGERADCIDHVIPFSKCKHNEEWNLVSACTSCNLKVKDRYFQSFEEKKKWILEARNVQEKKTHKDWHARVYGGWGRCKR